MRKFIFAAIFLCAGISLSAQDLPEIVYLKNGNLIRGKIVKLVPNKSLEIKSGDGKIYSYQMSEIIRIERNLSAPLIPEVKEEIKKEEEPKKEKKKKAKKEKALIIEDTETETIDIEIIENTQPKQSDSQQKKYYDAADAYNRRPYNSETYAYSGNESPYKEYKERGAFNIGIKGGTNFANFSGKGAEGTDVFIGFNAGIFIEYTLPSNFYFHSGVEFTMKGAKYEYSERIKNNAYRYEYTYNPMYIQLPIHAGYKGYFNDNISLGVHLGPYLAYGVGGNIKKEVFRNQSLIESKQFDFFGSKADGRSQAFDMGIGAGLDLDIYKFRIGVGYDMGLIDFGRDSEYPIRNQNIYAILGYKF